MDDGCVNAVGDMTVTANLDRQRNRQREYRYGLIRKQWETELSAVGAVLRRRALLVPAGMQCGVLAEQSPSATRTGTVGCMRIVTNVERAHCDGLAEATETEV